MEKNVRLANIYIKIHNKSALTVDDMRFLAIYDPDCFAKTCKNLLYNMPEAKPLTEKEIPSQNISSSDLYYLEKNNQAGHSGAVPAESREANSCYGESGNANCNTADSNSTDKKTNDLSEFKSPEQIKAELFLNNLSKIDLTDFVFHGINTEHVKNLVGNLYMEMLFPHNNKNNYFEMYNEDESSFNKKV